MLVDSVAGMPTYAEQIDALEQFRQAYVAYLEHPSSERRSRYNQLLPAAEAALRRADRVPGIAPPPMFGGGPYQMGLAAVVMGIERWNGGVAEIQALILDPIDQAIAVLRSRASHPEPARPALPDGYIMIRKATVAGMDEQSGSMGKVASLCVSLLFLVGIVYSALRWVF
jgi:hypothetical protein